jgi:hypothetical protein
MSGDDKPKNGTGGVITWRSIVLFCGVNRCEIAARFDGHPCHRMSPATLIWKPISRLSSGLLKYPFAAKNWSLSMKIQCGPAGK